MIKKSRRNRFYRVAFVLLLTVIITGVVHADSDVPERIRVGLFYGDSALNQVTVDADHGFSFGLYGDDEYFELFNLSPYNKLLFEEDQYYHIRLESTYTDEDDFNAIYSAMKSVDASFFAGYEGGWNLYFGTYLSKGEAADSMASLADEYPDFDMSIMEPKTSRIRLTQYGEDAFLYTADADYVLKDNTSNGEPEIIRIGDQAYRDAVIVKPQSDGRLMVINALSMQAYLYGVVPREMSKDWPLEALKAQAVAARNYAMLGMEKHASQGFDICSTSHCQVYGGYSYEGPVSNAAVDATEGLVLHYGSELVQTYYHSNSGGQTENSENIWSSEIPYLRGVSDPYSINAPNSSWSVSVTKSSIQTALEAYGYSIGSVESVAILDKSENGRVQKLQIVGSRGSVVLTKEETRKVLGYSTIKSTWFSFGDAQGIPLITSRGQHSASGSRLSVFNGSTAASIDVNTLSVYNGKSYGKVENKETETGHNIVFYGHGYGHGLGMSQWGAKAMAEQGFDFEAILTHYYVDTYVGN